MPGRIKDPTIAGLILGKISRARELNIEMKIDDNSSLRKRPGALHNNNYITILGNLIENAMDALERCEKKNKTIRVLVKEDEDGKIIEVQDTGCGIEEKYLASIFERGFTTKEGNRGRGRIKGSLQGLVIIWRRTAPILLLQKI